MNSSWLRLVHTSAPSLEGLFCLPAGRSYAALASCLIVAAACSGCSLIDDFDKFRIVADAGADEDAGALEPRDAAGPLCGGEDCSRLDGPCTEGECVEGRCVATPVREGRVCGDDPCVVCRAGSCSSPKDCSEYDGPCSRGMCNPDDGACIATHINEGRACFDNDPCTVNERCESGTCSGIDRDCSRFDDQCSVGMCDRETGLCTSGTLNESRTCDDFDPCTTNDRCDATGLCIPAGNAPAGVPCNDFNTCTGTSASPDVCDGSGTCTAGANVPAGQSCDDDNECTESDRCNATGVCAGQPDRELEGQACEAECKVGNTCQSGVCLDDQGMALGYRPECYFNWCDSESLCQDRWRRDGVCDCGCDFNDPDCNECSARMCEAQPDLMHRAAKWCDANGEAIDLCPDSLKNDGKCDCGCQFDDPDCAGGRCCGATGEPGCGDAFIEDCVCEREARKDADPSCCTQGWTQRCAELAVQLGCMICP